MIVELTAMSAKGRHHDRAQFTVKDSKKYAASGGWGFADFTKGKSGDEALHEKCFPCHAPAKGL